MENSTAQRIPRASDSLEVGSGGNTLLDYLLKNSLNLPDKIAFSDIDIDLNAKPICYAELLVQVKNCVHVLRKKEVHKGDTCLLIFNQGIEFIVAFLACQWLGAIPVPLPIPGRAKPLTKWENIAKECLPVVVISSEKSAHKLKVSLSRSTFLTRIPLIPVKVDSEGAAVTVKSDNFAIDLHTTAFLQYTSGSTGKPKGVVVTHSALMENAKASKKNMNASVDSIFVSWLPFYHDMGLNLFIVQTIYCGASLYLLKPEDFMSKPLNWAYALSKWQGTHTGGPNFAYHLLTDKLLQLHQEVKDGSFRRTLSLRSLRMCACGAEPIRIKTVAAFQNAISLFGATDHVISPGYGLAEATLTVALKQEGEPVHWVKLDKQALQQHKVLVLEKGILQTGHYFPEDEKSVYLVGNGKVIDNHGITLVNVLDMGASMLEASFKKPCLGAYVIGELCFTGPSLTSGYYNNRKATDATYIYSKCKRKVYLRTGDLAFKDKDGEIYIVGRIKDLLIIRGLNYYPQDIERSAYAAHPNLRVDGAAAFAIEKHGEETCCIMQELKREALRAPDFDAYAKAIRMAVLKDQGIRVETIFFVAPMQVPRTSSGKIQRQLTKQRTEQQAWQNTLYISHLGAMVSQHNTVAVPALPTIRQQVLETISHKLAHFLETRVDSLSIDERRTIPAYIISEFAQMGLLGLLISPQSNSAGAGLGLAFGQARKLLETIAAADVTLGLFATLHNLLGLQPIAKFGQASVRDTILAELASGQGTASFALTEPEAGSNPKALKTVAQKRDGLWILNGEKCWVGSSSWASYLTVIAHSRDEDGRYLGLSAFLVPQGTAGLQHLEECNTMGMRATMQGHFIMQDVALPDSHVLGEVGKGQDLLREVLCMGRLGINSLCIGVLKTVLSRAKGWAENRKVNTGYLIDVPVVLKRLQQQLWVLEIVEAFQDRLSKWLDTAPPIPEVLINASKIFATEETWKAVDFLMQITAARGYSEPNGIAQLFRDTRVLRIFEGPTESLIADLGGRSTDDLSLVMDFLVAQQVPMNTTLEKERLQRIKRQLEVLDELEGYEEPSAGTPNLYARYAFGEVLSYVLIAWLCQDAVSEQARSWLTNKVNTSLHHYLAVAGKKLSKQQVDRQFKQVLKDHKCIYTQPSLSAARIRSPFRDLRDLETNNRPQQQLKTKDTLTASAEDCHTRGTEIEDWIYTWLHREVHIERDFLTSSTTFSEYGLDSALSIKLISAINTRFGIQVEASIIWSYTTVRDLSDYLYTYEIKAVKPAASKPAKLDDDFLKDLLHGEI